MEFRRVLFRSTAGGGNWSMLVAGRLWVAGFGSPALGQRSGMSFAVAVDSGRGDRVSEGDTDLDALLAGDKAAWDRFVARHAGVIFAAVRRRLVPAGRSADAADGVPEGFVHLCQHHIRLPRSHDAARPQGTQSVARPVRQDSVRTSRSRWEPEQYKKKTPNHKLKTT